MNETETIIKDIIKKNFEKSNLYKRNLLKEYFQVLALDCIYSNEKYNKLVFYGGSCLSQCYSLPRLSEDLDFVDIEKKVSIEELADDLKNFFCKKTDFSVSIKPQKFRIYLKFPILKDFGLSSGAESDFLHLKIEIFKNFNFCRKYKTEIKPLFKNNKSILIKTFDLPTLMATKIRAVLHRKWGTIDKKGKTLISVKGRDYFDLMWYLEQGISPNLDCIEEVETIDDLKKKLLAIVEKIDYKSITLDLENFISDIAFVKKLGKNIKDILRNKIKDLK
ncbi:MAG: nucleotidyl transferase AbiEii/AbiGii toxin family protein [Candidatus Portnoybacteria bacterium]|nr:nucleotidyl transferase AbiEii/AbiGii toxin family protein [Candidatus Portnoybacteria bacterium]